MKKIQVAIILGIAASILSTPSQGCVAPPSGLVSWWPGESNATDVAGSNTGTLENGTGFIPGKVGGAFSFDGVNDNIRIPASASLNLGTQSGLTLEAWINPFNTAFGLPVFEWNNATATLPGLLMWVGHPDTATGFLHVNLYDGVADHVIETAPGTIVTNTMQHVALTYDKASGVARLFINGMMLTEQVMGTLTVRNTGDLYIGARLGSVPPKFFQGIIDEPSIYNRALTTNEIAAIYAAGSEGKCVPAMPPVSPVVISGPITNNGHAYLLLSGSTWPQAEAKAIELGGHLVTIDDAAENDWVFTNFSSFGGTNRHLWIGLNDEAQEGTFVWSSGEPVGYTFWFPGEPNNYSNDDYAHIWAPDQPDADRRWNDAPIVSVDEIGRPFCGVVEIAGVTPPPIVTCITPPSDLVSWWRGDSNVTDIVGTNAAVLEGGAGFSAGKVGGAFNLDGTDDRIRAPASGSLNIGLEAGYTLEAWINPMNPSLGCPLFEWNNASASATGLHMWLGHPDSAANYLYVNLYDGVANHVIETAPGTVASNTLQHVALTYDKASGVARLFINGVMMKEQIVGSITVRTAEDFYVGARLGTFQPRFFQGIIDEPSIYNRALTTNEIAAIYAAGSEGKCVPAMPPVSPVVISGPITNNGHAYLLLNGSTWPQAETKAIELGGHLVTIDDAAENDWVFTNFSSFGGTNRHLWIGLNDEAQEGTFVWSSGEPVTYTHWYPGEPNNYSNDDYAHIWAPDQPAANRRWNDAPIVSVDEIGRPFCGVVELAVAAPSLDPTISQHPTNRMVIAGSPTTFAAAATGSLPLAYQWRRNETNIAGATNATYNIAAVQESQAGLYSVRVTNLFGAAESSNALLTVLPLPTCVAAPSGLVGWWQGEGTLDDALGSSPGAQKNGLSFVAGKVGQSYNFDGINDYALISCYSTLNVGLGSGFTMEGWINPTTVAAIMPIVEYERTLGTANGNDVGVHLYISHPALGNGSFYANLLDTNQATHAVTTGPGLVQAGIWQHVALSYEKTSGLASIYLNGALVIQTNLGSFTPQTTFTNLLLGARTTFGSATSPSDKFSGKMDELSIYNRALTTNEVAAIYAAGSAGKCVPTTPVSPVVVAGPITNNGHAYLLLSGSTWPQAEAKAIELGGHLVTVNDDAENEWVWNTFGLFGGIQRELWIGFNDAAQESTFVWSSGEPVSYTRWYPGEPNNYNNDDYAHIYAPFKNVGAQWNDIDGTNSVDGEGNPFCGVVEIATNPQPGDSPVPQITSFSPALGSNGTLVTLTGTNFSNVAVSNVVYFGAVRAVVTLASPTSLTVIVPVGATFAPPTVTVGGLTAQASESFTPTFPGGGSISHASFAARVDLETGNGPTQTAIADLDGDGKPDLAITDDYANTISLFRNISVAGTLAVGSFEPRVVIPASLAAYSPYMLVAADVDGDGKLDLVTTDITGNTVSVFRNLAVPGGLSSNSFAPLVSFAVGAGPRQLAVADLDADGRPEIVTANYDGSTVSVLRNTGTTGQISTGSFAPSFNLAAGAGTHGVAVADLDGDGKPDLVTANNVSATLSLFRNIGSSPLSASSFAPEVQITAPASAHFLRAADLDGDGKPDLILTSVFEPLNVYRNQSTAGTLDTASFVPGVAFALSGRGHTISAGDLNGDGKVDLAVDTEIGDSVALFQNLATPGSFTSASLAARVDLATGWNAWGSSVGDLDGDGRPDVVFANAYEATVSICRNLIGDNRAPIADAGATASLVVSLNGSNAVVTLDGSHSSDPDNNTLAYAWFITGASNSIATGTVAGATLPLGTNQLILIVSDGLASGSDNFSVEVISAADAFDELRALVLSGDLRLRAIPLLTALRAAENALDHDHDLRATARLRAFQFWVRVLVQPTDPDLAAQLIAEAQAIIVAIGPVTSPTPHVVTIESISLGANGRPHLRINGQSGRVYIVEVSTNAADWVPLGEAADISTNVFEFDDNSSQTGQRFYRVVAPE